MVGIIVILVGVFYVAIGRGGELAYEQADHAPLDLGPVSATDVALLRPPTALWGYNMQVTDEALDRIARTLRDRDILIASLQRQLSDASRGLPVVPPIESNPLPGATGLTQAARWDEVIPARDESAASFGEATTVLGGTSAETDAIAKAGPATVELAASETGESAATTEQPRRFVPKHERPRKPRRTETSPAPPAEPPETTVPAEAPGVVETSNTAETGETAQAAESSASTTTEQTPPDETGEDAEEQGW